MATNFDFLKNTDKNLYDIISDDANLKYVEAIINPVPDFVNTVFLNFL